MKLPLFIVYSSVLVAAAGLGRAEVDFEKDIRPILAEKCTLCHGPDEAKAGLRLTSLEEATKELKSGESAIVPKKPDASHLLDRIHSDDPDEIMPPPDKAEPLTDAEKKSLAAWISEGATWPRHWAYEPLAEQKPPTVEGVSHPIDQFVLAKLNAEKIPPSSQAEPNTLIRRLHYDLIGLPPTPEAVAAFLEEWNANSVKAYAKLVDSLLASPRFGERWGRHWLDKARYADSDGYEKDNNRMNAWRYRDWVIDAINSDLPFDQFTIQQLAGDLLPEVGEEEKLATAFNRQTLTNTEGGTDKEQWRVAAVMDRTETLGAVWLGLTVGCARCHTHKYDEITHKEYYQLYAYFNNGDEANTKVKRSEKDWKKWEESSASHRKKIEEKKSAHAKIVAEAAGQMPGWEKQMLATIKTGTDSPEVVTFPIDKATAPKGTTLAKEKDGSYLAKGKVPDKVAYTMEGTLPAGTYSGIRLDVLTDNSLPSKGPGRAGNGNFVLSQLTVKVNGVVLSAGGARADYSQGGFPPPNAFDADPKKGWAIGGKIGEAHCAEFGFGEVLKIEKPAKIVIGLEQNYGGKHTLGRFKLGALAGISSLILPESLVPILKKPKASRSDEESKLLTDHFHSVFPSTRKSSDELAALVKAAPPAPKLDVRVIAQRTKDPRETHIFHRGEFKQPEDKVTTDTLSVLPEVDHRGESGDRLDLARWLVDGENPLPPRVTVNHIWGHLFGEGLVATVNDFGVRGDRPSHPELLDWLAAEFIRLDWSRKKLIRTIVMSDTYQQSSDHRPELMERDPKNRLLARQNRFRVEAETVRDISLAAAGLLSEKVGGPSVFPPIPAGVADVNYNSAFKWEVSGGEDRYRRGMYTFFKRTAPHPNLMTFDCPDSNVTSVVRTRSNTPLAALVTLNNETFHEAAVGLAKKVLEAHPKGGDGENIRTAFESVLARPPETGEAEALQSLLQKSRAYYESHPDEATKLFENLPAAEGASNPQELASWATTLRIVLNLDEFLTRS